MYKFLLLLLALSVVPQGISAQCEPQLLDCNSIIQACDLTPNATNYWNELGWWDNSNLTHDLAETKIELSIAVRDTCLGDTLSVRCLLFLDLDGNGSQETVVDSDNPPAAGMVNFGNALNPNYSGGTPRAFDQRPVPANLFWRFALKNTVVGDVASYKLHWVNDAAPGIAELPELAYGFHKVRWIVTNSAGAVKTCEKQFQVKDCKAPTVVCLNGLSVNIMPTKLITLWASDFLQYGEDNVTPANLIKISIRKSGTGIGFPLDSLGNPILNVTFSCDELGTQAVELWARDVAGNADFCETYVIVQDNLGNCGTPPGSFQVCAKTACGDAVEEANITVSGSPFAPPFWIGLSNANGCLVVPSNIPIAQGMILSAEKDNNPLWGVSQFDLLTIQKHIDGIDLFDTPYQWVAADANNDLKIDTFDIVECRKLLLGISTGPSWRFVDKSYTFPSPNPLSVPFPETITVDYSNPPFTPEFVAVKICDISCGNLVGFYDLEPENQHLIGAPEPNPTNEGAMLPLQLLGAENVLLELLDFSGRLLFRSEMYLPAGPALLEIPATALPQAGVYVWRVRAGEVAKSGKLVRY
ncbi:MAG: hypothetical protein H7246_16270 [Phycisphaerae bacterium]|nr:hypothetical protein [Saprospiraceae bacterium]